MRCGRGMYESQKCKTIKHTSAYIYLKYFGLRMVLIKRVETLCDDDNRRKLCFGKVLKKRPKKYGILYFFMKKVSSQNEKKIG